MKRLRWLVGALSLLAALVGGGMSAAEPDASVQQFLRAMYDHRAKALITGSAADGLTRFYDQSLQPGRFALAHEEGRITYVQAWAKARNLQIIESENFLTNLRITVTGNGATVSVIVRNRLAYRYGEGQPLNEMGIGSWHWLQLTRAGDGWQVQKEYYLDGLGSEWSEPFVPTKRSSHHEEAAPAAGRGSIDRAGLVKYAETYCGAAWGCGNNSDYNQRYRTYRNLGGDCANFASQALVEGGKLKPDWTWRHDKAGSACWVNAQAFVHYLTGSGRATLLARGNYAKVAPALAKLEPGDIIGYELKGTITHVSIVTGKDSAGVPLVAAHTADRFRNPWDLGWDKATVYYLVHIR